MKYRTELRLEGYSAIVRESDGKDITHAIRTRVADYFAQKLSEAGVDIEPLPNRPHPMAAFADPDRLMREMKIYWEAKDRISKSIKAVIGDLPILPIHSSEG